LSAFGAVTFGGQLLAFLIGAATVALGQVVAHRYSLRRERRAEFVDVLDRTIRSYVAGDSALSHLIAAVGTGLGPEVAQIAADRVTQQEIEIRAARFSLVMRLRADHPLPEAFEVARRAFTDTYVALGPAIMNQVHPDPAQRAGGPSSVEDANAYLEEFRGALSEAVGQARTALLHGNY
jgi:hypothetical protein